MSHQHMTITRMPTRNRDRYPQDIYPTQINPESRRLASSIGESSTAVKCVTNGFSKPVQVSLNILGISLKMPSFSRHGTPTGLPSKWPLKKAEGHLEHAPIYITLQFTTPSTCLQLVNYRFYLQIYQYGKQSSPSNRQGGRG